MNKFIWFLHFLGFLFFSNAKLKFFNVKLKKMKAILQIVSAV